ncbi:GRASP55/65 PDZ-like domain-containing protein [Hypoxylon sp. FL1284]|nr:GRASP55/65 PDZ-like domain-containing protein [Hypoxylon sp. FL1284]
MFNALNRYLSRLDGDARSQHYQNQHQRDVPGYGFQVLRNTNLGLAAEPWFDYVVGINGRAVEGDAEPRLFAQEVRNCAGGRVALGLWSAKGQRTRVLHVEVPSPESSGSSPSLLGLSLQWAPLALASNVWHVLDVAAGSPADAAGLLPYGDYVLGTPDGALHGEAGLGELVDDYVGRPLKLWVYNNEYDVAREVEIVPSRDWGGEGALGCVLGYGALHRLPAPLSEPVSAPGETMFDGDNTGAGDQSLNFATLAPPPNDGAPPSAFVPAAAASSDFLVPAQMTGATGTPPPPPAGAAAPSRTKKKERHGHGGASRLDDYFAEEEKKSRALDGNISASKTPPPPPPKAGGGPPRAPPKAEQKAGDGGDDVD